MRNWSLGWDMNYDGVTTITDISLLIKSLFFYPGDYIIQSLIGTSLGNFLEITSYDYGGILSGTSSVICWLLVPPLIYEVIFSKKDVSIKKDSDGYIRKPEEKNSEIQRNIERIQKEESRKH